MEIKVAKCYIRLVFIESVCEEREGVGETQREREREGGGGERERERERERESVIFDNTCITFSTVFI